MKKEEFNFLPVILGGDLAAYSIARAFHEEYHIKSIAISTAKGFLNSSSDILNTFVVPDFTSNNTFLETLSNLGEKYKNHKKLILIGCRDWHVRMIIENYDFLEKYYILPYIRESLLNKLVLKDSFYDLCEQYNIDYPRTLIYDFSKESSLELPFNFPVIAKPANSAEYYSSTFIGQKKVYKVNTLTELKNILNNIKENSSYRYKFLIQEYVPGDDTNMHILTCYCDKNSKVRFAAFGHTILENHDANSIGNPVAIINEVNLEIINKIAKFLESIHYVGFANFDIKFDPRDNKYKFFEINTRLGNSNFYITGSGFNVAKWIVDDYILNKEFDNEITIANQEFLYSIVPKSVIMNCLQGHDLKIKARSLYKQNKISNPINYNADKKFLLKLYKHYFMFSQKKKFSRYLRNEKKDSLSSPRK